MSQDDNVIGFVSQSDLLGIMRETGMIAIQDTATAEGKPVIHALLKIVNAQTGGELPGGLPFSVVMFKGAGEAGYSNIAIGAVVPAVELGIDLPADFFNLCNQRFRFIRAFPIEAGAFVIQMDLFLRNATREYVKFSFGLWSAMFAQVLFELMGRTSTGVSRAAEIYAAARSNIASRTFDAVAAAPDEPEMVAPVADPEAMSEPATEPSPEPEAAEVTPVDEGAASQTAEPVAEAIAEDAANTAQAGPEGEPPLAENEAVSPPSAAEPEKADA